MPVYGNYNPRIFEVRSPVGGLFRADVEYVGFARMAITSSASPNKTGLNLGVPNVDDDVVHSAAFHLWLKQGINQLTFEDLSGAFPKIDRLKLTRLRESSFGSGPARSVEGEADSNRFIGERYIGAPGLIGFAPIQIIYSCRQCSGGKMHAGGFDDSGIQFDVRVPTAGVYEFRLFFVSSSTDEFRMRVNGGESISFLVRYTRNQVPDSGVKYATLKKGANRFFVSGDRGIDKIVIGPPGHTG